MFFKPLGILLISSFSGGQIQAPAFDIFAHRDDSESIFNQVSEVNWSKDVGIHQHEYEFAQFPLNFVQDSYIDENILFGSATKDLTKDKGHSLLVRPLNDLGNEVIGNTEVDVINLLVRGGPVWKDDHNLHFKDLVFDKYKMFAHNQINTTYGSSFRTLFDSHMLKELTSQAEIYMLNEEQFFINKTEFIRQIQTQDTDRKNQMVEQINYLNSYHLHTAIQQLHARYPKKKINLISWSYGSLVGNATLALWPELINEVNKWISIGTAIDQNSHSYFDEIDQYFYYSYGSRIPAEEPRNRLFCDMINTTLFSFSDFLRNLGLNDNFDYFNFLSSTHKLTFIQNAHDKNIGPLSFDEINQIHQVGQYIEDSVDWEVDADIRYPNLPPFESLYLNHYAFKNHDQSGQQLLDLLAT